VGVAAAVVIGMRSFEVERASRRAETRRRRLVADLAHELRSPLTSLQGYAALLRRHAERRLTTSLLSIAESEPRLLFCLADEVSVELLTQDIEIDVPVGRVERPAGQVAAPDADDGNLPPVPYAAHVIWQTAPPLEGSPARALFEKLSARGLLLEPFDRAADALREVYGARPPE